jgi:hypothetical protein
MVSRQCKRHSKILLVVGRLLIIATLGTVVIEAMEQHLLLTYYVTTTEKSFKFTEDEVGYIFYPPEGNES